MWILLLVVAYLWWKGDGDVAAGAAATVDDLRELTSSEESRLEELEYETQGQVRGLISDLSSQGIAVYVGSTLRSAAAEADAIASGRSAVTSVSWHQIGRAVDLYPIDPDTGSADYNGVRVDLFQAMVAAARARGFRSLAFEDDGVTKHYITTSRGKVWDGGHLEWRAPYATIAEAVSAEGSTYGLG